ncbi:IclR family transcriptional regulator [Pseudodonghicola flavimaris]|uniref:IclR family transcriptional regulator n=1 Tax=Pseudodonghicola flavimaris TaxID=3050036 RepID=A0ABT7F6C7_9RHOB|nr:IclR family transcriptional regulator [Pseudodonghicola flavimaris]MDK3020170.1 IclR family transcriptional regulator [Pseudodonghicola flavimaris]
MTSPDTAPLADDPAADEFAQKKPGPEYSVPPVERAFRLLRHIAAGNRCRNSSRAAKELGINRTTLIRLLATLEAERMIEQLPEDGGYRLGTGLIALATQALNDRGIIPTARPVLKALAQKLGLSTHLGVREGREIVYLARETPVSHLASSVREGSRLPAHATTIGRILLAELSPAELRELYRGHALEAYTDKTRTSLDELESQLATDRAQGMTWSVANFEHDIGSAAVAVYDHKGQAVAAINVTGHASVFAEDSAIVEDIKSDLRAAAQEISEALGYRGWRADQM